MLEGALSYHTRSQQESGTRPPAAEAQRAPGLPLLRWLGWPLLPFLMGVVLGWPVSSHIRPTLYTHSTAPVPPASFLFSF